MKHAVIQIAFHATPTDGAAVLRAARSYRQGTWQQMPACAFSRVGGSVV